MDWIELGEFCKDLSKEECDLLCRAMRVKYYTRRLGRMEKLPSVLLTGVTRYRHYRELLRCFAEGHLHTRGHFQDTWYYKDLRERAGGEYASADVWEFYNFYWGVVRHKKILKPPYVIDGRVDGEGYVKLFNGKHRVCIARFLGSEWIKSRVVTVTEVRRWRKRLKK